MTTNSSSPWRGKHGPLLIAEIGGNHEGDFTYAQELARLAIGSGADYVKFQIYTGDTLVSPMESPDRNKHFKRFELTLDQHRQLATMCRDASVGYMASVWDPAFLQVMDDLMPIYKIGSGDLTAYPMLRAHAEGGKPIILSTGLSTLEEAVAAAAYIQQCNPAYRSPEMLALLQCTSMYPIEARDSNLRVMDALRAATGVAVGYSDHTRGSRALLVAAARGAQVLEFHFTDSREGKTFRDHAVSLTADEVRELCVELEQIEELLGSPAKRPLACEIDTGHVISFRRAVYSRRALTKGEVLRAEDLVVLRPNHGVDARDFDNVVGRAVAQDTAPFQALKLI